MIRVILPFAIGCFCPAFFVLMVVLGARISGVTVEGAGYVFVTIVSVGIGIASVTMCAELLKRE